jgi:hypothetical protein
MERKEKKKVVKDKLRREREEAQLMDLDALDEMDDWKELTRERKRRLETVGGKKAASMAEIPVFDL